ncbi:cytochrome P450 2G1-like [Pelobates cultripes]|uniref:Cytochrome P450 2G1-like n=1 Tax=Pelobates cultripes TaxID=61616 RepID=A0AAD1SYC2_PELCU|nr:cytochrome P450 2G1-like [Pelobates cultripes]
MDTVTLLLIFLVSCILCFYTWNSMYREQNLPPGPTPLPFLGNLLQLKTGQLVDCLSQMHKKYGDVYTLYLGPRRVVVLCGYDAVKEALVDNGEEFGFRGQLPVIDLYTRRQGVIFSNGDQWKELRRFTVMTLRSFGMGKRSIEERIKEEALCLVEEFKRKNGEHIDPTYYFSQVASNIICSIIFGNRFSYTDPDFRRFMRIIDEIFIGMSSPSGQLFDMFNVVMKYLPGPHHYAAKCAFKLDEFVLERLERDRKTLDPNRPRHMMDSFLIKMEEEKNNPSTYYNTENLLKNTSTMFVAGTETLSTTLRHTFLLFLKFPHIKKKVQEEIDSVIGRDRAPEPEDRPSMPYTDAVIHEIQRYANVLPMNLPRAVAKDTQFRGFTIPKGTDVFPILTFVLRDPKYFPDPFTFNPDRFLDENGEFKKNEAFMAFSAGKRVCLGESLARLELFIFITTLLQHFDINEQSARRLPVHFAQTAYRKPPSALGLGLGPKTEANKL